MWFLASISMPLNNSAHVYVLEWLSDEAWSAELMLRPGNIRLNNLRLHGQDVCSLYVQHRPMAAFSDVEGWPFYVTDCLYARNYIWYNILYSISARPSLCTSYAGVASKRLNISSFLPDNPIILVHTEIITLLKFRLFTPNGDVFRWSIKIRNFRQSDRHISATMQDSAIVSIRIAGRLYCILVFASALKRVTAKLQSVLDAAARLISGTQNYDRGLSQLMHYT